MDGDGPGSSHKGKKIQTYTAAFKLKVIGVAKANNNNSLAAKTFGVDRKRVIEWRKIEATLKDQKGTRMRSLGAGRKVSYPDIDEKLKEWIEKRRKGGARITGKALKRECLRLHHQNGQQGFKASCGWLRQFMKRNRYSFRRTTHVAQKNEELLSDRMQSFLRFVVTMRKKRDYPLSAIGNMDETPIWVDMPGNYTMEIVGQKTISMVSTGHEKSRITVMLGAMADGTKLAPMVLFKGVRPPKDIEIPAGIIVKMTPQAWANAEVIKHWLRMVWRRNNVQKRLLVWDAFSGHITPPVKEEVRKLYNSDMAVIPGGCTSRLQPCDVSWNRPFKDAFRDLYDDWLIEGTVELTRGKNRKAPPRPLLLRWIKKAWDSVSPDVVRKSFRVTGISLAMDGTEDDQLFHESDDDDDDDVDPFEGFTVADRDVQAQMLENVEAAEALEMENLEERDQQNYMDFDEYSEGSEEEEEDETYEDPGSPGR